MLEEKLSKVLEKWRKEEIDLVSPYSEKQVLSTFKIIDELVSKDIIQLFITIGVNGDMDNNLLSFWNLEQLVSENNFYSSDFTLFGDFLIFSHLYGFNYEDENISSVYSDFETGAFLKIADSIEEFLHIYLTNPLKIGLYKE